MKNINRKNINGLRTYNDSYMQHNPIPDFTLGGSRPFTLQVFFSLLSDSSRGVPQSQRRSALCLSLLCSKNCTAAKQPRLA